MKDKKIQLTPEQSTSAQNGSAGTALLFYNLGAGCGWMVKATNSEIHFL